MKPRRFARARRRKVERLGESIAAAKVSSNCAALWWLGQAGFALKTSGGTVIYYDPYLSNAVYRTDGFKRMTVTPIEAEEVRADLVVISHEHTDHLDPDAIPVIAANNPDCTFAAPSGCVDGLTKAGVARKQIEVLSPGKPYAFRDTTVHPGNADHGHFSPSAISVALDLAGVKVMMSGDTSWRTDFFKPLFDLDLDVLIPCINGCFGNMGHLDAARMVAESRARMTLPCHFWMFAEQGAGDPIGFINACRLFAPRARAMLVSPGEYLLVQGHS
jgi:L-ascorbate 6-phosphate lactonase